MIPLFSASKKVCVFFLFFNQSFLAISYTSSNVIASDAEVSFLEPISPSVSTHSKSSFGISISNPSFGVRVNSLRIITPFETVIIVSADRPQDVLVTL